MAKGYSEKVLNAERLHSVCNALFVYVSWREMGSIAYKVLGFLLGHINSSVISKKCWKNPEFPSVAIFEIKE